MEVRRELMEVRRDKLKLQESSLIMSSILEEMRHNTVDSIKVVCKVLVFHELIEKSNIAIAILDFSLLLPIELSLFQLCDSKSCCF